MRVQDRTKRHNLLEMITIALCAAICGADTWVDVEQFGKTLKHKGIAIDGKTMRGSFDAATGKSALHVVSAWACGLRVSLGQVAVDGKSNEIPAVRKLLEISGAVVTLDAMHCQTETLTAIRAKGADFLVAVKDNLPALYITLLEFFAEHGERDFRAGGIRRQRGDDLGRCRIASLHLIGGHRECAPDPPATVLTGTENLWHYLRSHYWSNRTYAKYDKLFTAIETS